ncbi:MAG: hypothetical protein WKG07_02160 [Hymenobacter sp.]
MKKETAMPGNFRHVPPGTQRLERGQREARHVLQRFGLAPALAMTRSPIMLACRSGPAPGPRVAYPWCRPAGPGQWLPRGRLLSR